MGVLRGLDTCGIMVSEWRQGRLDAIRDEHSEREQIDNIHTDLYVGCDMPTKNQTTISTSAMFSTMGIV